jgi:hypothetical protein
MITDNGKPFTYVPIHGSKLKGHNSDRIARAEFGDEIVEKCWFFFVWDGSMSVPFFTYTDCRQGAMNAKAQDESEFLAGRQSGKTGCNLWIDEVCQIDFDHLAYMMEMFFEREPIAIPCDHEPDPALRSVAMPDIHGFIQATESEDRLESREKARGMVGMMQNLAAISGLVSRILEMDNVIIELIEKVKIQTAIDRRFPRHEIIAGLRVA